VIPEVKNCVRVYNEWRDCDATQCHRTVKRFSPAKNGGDACSAESLSQACGKDTKACVIPKKCVREYDSWDCNKNPSPICTRTVSKFIEAENGGFCEAAVTTKPCEESLNQCPVAKPRPEEKKKCTDAKMKCWNNEILEGTWYRRLANISWIKDTREYFDSFMEKPKGR